MPKSNKKLKKNLKIKLPKIFRRPTLVEIIYGKVRKAIKKTLKPLKKKENVKKLAGVLLITVFALSMILPYVVTFIFR